MKTSEYRKKIERQVRAAAKVAKKGANAFRKGSESPARRMRALQQAGQLQDPRALAAAKKVAFDAQEPPKLRAAAVAHLGPLLPKEPAVIERLMDFIGDEGEAIEVKGAALGVLKQAAFSVKSFRKHRPRYVAALRKLAETDHTVLRHRALGVLAREKDERTLKRLESGLIDPKKAMVAPEKALQLLAYDTKRDNRGLLHGMLKKAPSEKARLQALRNLGSDPSSAKVFEDVLRDRSEAPEARVIAMSALKGLKSERLQTLASEIAADSSEHADVRAASRVAARAYAPLDEDDDES